MGGARYECVEATANPPPDQTRNGDSYWETKRRYAAGHAECYSEVSGSEVGVIDEIRRGNRKRPE